MVKNLQHHDWFSKSAPDSKKNCWKLTLILLNAFELILYFMYLQRVYYNLIYVPFSKNFCFKNIHLIQNIVMFKTRLQRGENFIW